MKTTKYCISLLLLTVMVLSAQNRRTLEPAPDQSEGDGPHKRLIIRGGTLIDGTGAPPRGPVDIVVEGNKITRVASVGTPFIEINVVIQV